MPSSSAERSTWRHRPQWASGSTLVVLLLAVTASGVLVGSVPGTADAWSRSAITAAQPGSRADPVPFGAEGTAGPWRFAVEEVVVGDGATVLVTDADPLNEPPREGFTYVAVRLRASNASGRPLALTGDDFALTTDSGFVRRFVGAIPPAPAIDGTVAPGETLVGWVVLGARADDANLILLYDSLALDGGWADRAFALAPGAAVADAAAPADMLNDAGISPADPAKLGEPLVTTQWRIEVLEVARGMVVYDLSDRRVQALGPAAADDPTDADGDGAVGWVALRLRVGNVQAGGAAAFLPPSAFMLAMADGTAVPNTLTLTPPSPDASGDYYPGASREGWVAFEIPAGYDLGTVRFLPYRTDTDPRYLTWE